MNFDPNKHDPNHPPYPDVALTTTGVIRIKTRTNIVYVAADRIDWFIQELNRVKRELDKR